MYNFQKAINNISPYIKKTPLELNKRLSKKYNCNIFLKREDLQITRSFKIRGALNKILNSNKYNTEFVCASAGNHAQGVAFACSLLNLKGHIFVPEVTPIQKINRILSFGQNNINLNKIGNKFDESLKEEIKFSNDNRFTFIHPYDDKEIIEGQGTIALEIIEDIKPDIILSCIGGGGLISGLTEYVNQYYDKCKIYGVEPSLVNSMETSLRYNKLININSQDSFVDGASVSQVGSLPFEICNKYLNYNDIKLVNNGQLCNKIIELYQEDGIILEPAGALSITALDQLDKKEIENKNIVCILSGGNNDLMRYNEIIERNLIYLGIKHYYIIEFSQKPKELKKFILNVLGEKDDITRFEYIKKTNKSYGKVLLGIETNNNKYFEERLKIHQFKFQKIEENDLIYSFII